MEDDFSPVVEAGIVEEPTGPFRRFKRPKEAAPSRQGLAQVMVGADGRAVDALSAGQRYWESGRRWVRVDVTSHTLNYEIRFLHASGHAGFVAAVTVRATVNDAHAAATAGASSVKDELEPALQNAIADAAATVDPAMDDQNPVKALNDARTKTDAALRKRVRGDLKGVPAWLTADVTAIRVSFDAATQRHHDTLVKHAQEGHVIKAVGANTKIEKTIDLDVRDLVRERLIPHLSNASTRAFEFVMADPSAANIEHAVNQVNRAEFLLLGEGLNLLRNMVEKDYLDKDDPLYRAIESISGKLENMYLPSAATAIAGAEAPEQLAAARDIPAEAQPGDRDFSDG